MKKIFILLILIISILLVSGCNNNEEQTNPDKEIEGKTEEVEKVIDKTAFKVLSIGNSFSDNATKHLYEIAKAYGFEEVIIGNLFMRTKMIFQH
jgi:ABC-type Fe3+-citrate transport system substrate-binding protein